ncbi:hypothetical protein SDC9_171447 [bioreactor metagenome]|uniref:Uncharacterized protein n=1 Tax=bioreactor metagenome TaxID=1076179 RepID=A0A645GK10_9ZZZZ
MQGMELPFLSEEIKSTLLQLTEHRGEIHSFRHMPAFPEYHFSDTEFKNFENIIMKASNALGTIMLEPKEKFLVSYMLVTKLSIETFNGSEYIHEAESFE